MYSITVRTEFNAAHKLRGYRGKCERLHGHNWYVAARFSSKKLNKQGMVLDFKKAKAVLSKVVSVLDHRYLNDIPYFKKTNPSSESIAKYIFDRVKRRVRAAGCALKEISVWETETSCAVYSEEER
ncbi:6-carboxytetrahydropterin synthase QueD [Candidatus Omnitrophota bacterium]